MLKTVLRFGLTSGALISAMTAIMIPMCFDGTIDFSYSQVVGYSAMVLSFLLVFFGVRSYRDNVAGGTIGFWRAFQVGILITLVSCAMYVIAWEIVYFNFIPDFLDVYNAHVQAKMRASGATEAALQAQTVEAAKLAKIYANPFWNSAITFMEIFPVGLILTLVSAGILRRSPTQPTPPPAALPA